MTERPRALLRVEPHTIPALIAAFDNAIHEMRPLLGDLERSGRLPEAWLGDPVSNGVRDWYHQRVMGDADAAGDSAYAKLRAYETELTRIREALGAMRDSYAANEDGIAASMGRA